MMDQVKAEPEGDPLAIQTSDNSLEDKKTFSEEADSLNLLSTKIKPEFEDLTPGIKLEGTPVPSNSATVKCEAEELSCYVNTVKEEILLEETTHEVEVTVQSFADTHDRAASLGSEGFTPPASRGHGFKKRFRCVVPEKSSWNSGILKSHICGHASEDKHSNCDICDNYFSEEEHLNQTVECHASQKCFSHSGGEVSHERQAIQMQCVWIVFLVSQQVETRTPAHRREAIQMRYLWKVFRG